MSDGVKGRGPSQRTYDASGRQEKARASRRRVVAAARELFEERGYATTTVAEVAGRAGVSAESIYKGFGSKAALAKAVFDVLIAGDDQPLAVAARPEFQRIAELRGAAPKLRLYAEGAAARLERSARLQLVLRDGAALDAAVADLWRQVQDERLIGTTGFARHLAESGGLRAGVDVDEVRDVLWTCIAVETYDLLVHQRGWTPAAYTDWLTRTLVASVVGTDTASTDSRKTLGSAHPGS